MCAGLLAWGVPDLAAELAVSHDGQTAQGEVVRVDGRSQGPDTVIVRFTTAAGREVTASVDGESVRTGDAVSVR